MNRTISLVAMLIVLSLVTPSWSGPPNPTDSDANFNTAGGTDALDSVTTGQRNTAFGYLGLRDLTTGNHNTAVGIYALTNNTSGNFNTAVGYTVLANNTNGLDNTAAGARTLFFNTTGSSNTAVGSNTLGDNTTGNNNTVIGSVTLGQSTTASDNTAIGGTVLGDTTTGNSNTATGRFALTNNTTGSLNSASGMQTLLLNLTGIKNTAIGFQALRSSTGHRNIAIGYLAGEDLANGNNNIYVGHGGAADESLTTRLGSNQTSALIAGIAGTAVNGPTVVVDANGQLGVVLSSARYKRDIAALGARSAGVLHLRPVTFAYREDAPGTLHYGLIAEEVAAVYPELVTSTATGEVQTVQYQRLIPLLLNELQQQERGLQHEQQVIERQQQGLEELRVLVEQHLSSAGPSGAWRIR